ncbi:MAG: hypothetical protein KF745_02790 [Phycisphaeraceae bacterium]|nr:hypothetical protein [Phycisphaeraceae bacterium]
MTDENRPGESLLERYTGRRPAGAGGPGERGGEPGAADSPFGSASLSTAQEEGTAEDLGAFGWLRGIRDRAVMLELRKSDGTILAIGYGWLERAEFHPSDGIVLHVLGRTIKIRGRNLNRDTRPGIRLYEGIVRHRVPWLRQADAREDSAAGDSAAVIEDIQL